MNQQEHKAVSDALVRIEEKINGFEEKLSKRKNYCKCYNILLISVIFGVGLALIIGAGVDYEDHQNITKFGRDMMITFGISICLPYIIVFLYASVKGCNHHQSCCKHFTDAIGDIAN